MLKYLLVVRSLVCGMKDSLLSKMIPRSEHGKADPVFKAVLGYSGFHLILIN